MSRSDNDNAIYVKCDCGCCVLEISREVFADETTYNIAVLDSRYDHKANGVLNRIKRAAKALIGKPVYFNDVLLSEEHYERLMQQMSDLRYDMSDLQDTLDLKEVM